MERKWFVKLLGFCFVVLASVLLGFYKSLEFAERYSNLKQLKWCILLLKGDIRYQSSPIPETFLRLAKKMAEPYQSIFITISMLFRREREASFQTIWTKVWLEQRNALFFMKEDMEIITSFGEVFGYLDLEMQMNQFEYFLNQLDQQIEDAKKKKQSGQKLYQTLGWFGGIFFVILFW